jgi:hypothetical protein
MGFSFATDTRRQIRNEIFSIRIIMQYVIKFSRYFDRYVEFYNRYNGDKISALAELSVIKTEVKEVLERTQDMIENVENSLINKFLEQIVNQYCSDNNIEFETDEVCNIIEKTYRDEITILIDVIFHDLFSTRDAENGKSELLSLLENISPEATESVKHFIGSGFKYLIESQELASNYHSLVHLNSKIIHDGYPDSILRIDDLPPNERKIFMDQIKPHNYKGTLTDKCIEDLESHAEEFPDLNINRFFNSAHTQYPSCRYAVREKNGVLIEIKISWSKLRNETKKLRPDIYYRNNKPRKN